MELGSHWTDFHEIWYLSIFRRSVEKIENRSLKSDKKTGTLREHACAFMIITHGIIVTRRNVSDKSCIENQNTRFFFCSVTFISKIVPLMR